MKYQIPVQDDNANDIGGVFGFCFDSFLSKDWKKHAIDDCVSLRVEHDDENRIVLAKLILFECCPFLADFEFSYEYTPDGVEEKQACVWRSNSMDNKTLTDVRQFLTRLWRVDTQERLEFIASFEASQNKK
jgi:hypothetical protein